MPAGEAFLSAFLQVLFDRLAPGDLSFFPRPGLVLAELRKWKKMLLKIEAVLADAEEKQLMDKLVKLWLDDLRDLAYDLEDLLDELATEELERKLMADQRSILADAGRALMFYTGMKSKMDDISNRLDRIWEEKDEIGLIKKIARGGGTSISLHQRISSTCLPTELDVYGRDEDTAKILEMVLNDESTDANFRVISIIGMGGIGKTTLARKVYNDEALIDFYPKAWVCVSDDFDVLRISKAILESITGSSCDLKDLNAVQIQLKKIAGVKFFLVLDDVWSKNYSSWKILRSPFLFGSLGSKIVVTTRHEDVALTMGRFIECCKLKLLSDDDCWSVFKKHAYEAEVTSAHHMGLMREKVVEKCKGLPLAAKILGGLIRSKQRDDEWLDLFNSKIWDLPDESEIPAALKLSYHHLPSNLKRCFAYCAILPNDYEFEEDELVFLWIAEGLIQQSNENKQLEDLGHEYFHDLLLRSIFQQSTSNKSKYMMHDLISDLAQWVSGDTCFSMEGDAWGSRKQLSKIEKVRHFSYTCGDFDGKSKFQAFNEIEQVQRLRTFLPLSRIHGESNVHYISHMVIFDLLSKFKKLRLLCLKDYYVTELPESLGHLRHLRCLNLSGTKLKSLPESTSLLINLQILNLKNCSPLMKLPFEMRNLINLRYLDIRGTSLTEMPFGMKELKSLRKLSNFIVGKGMGSYVNDLTDLKFLREELCISRLENTSDSHEPREMILNDIKGLKVLQFEWGSLFDDTRNEAVEKNVLDMLRPYQNLEKLTVKFYGGIEFPPWLGNLNFSNMMVLRLENCEKCTSLPSLGTLGSLKDLTIKGMRGLKCIGSELCGEGFSKPFHLLESLHFEDLQEWENWKPNKDNEHVDSFFCLRELSIVECPKLSGRLPGHLPSLEKLVVKNCEELVVSFSNISMVCGLEIDRIKGMACDSKIDLKSLKSMSLSNISEFGNWLRQEFPLIERLNLKNVGLEPLMHLCQLKPPQGLQKRFTSLRKLRIENCSTLVSFPEVCFLYNLSELEIRNCTSLTSLLDKATKHNNSCLEHLEIVRCDSLTVLVGGQLPSSIKRLIVRDCKKLQCLLDDRESSSLLEYLYVLNCPSLVWLSSGGQLPTTLKDLSVECCENIWISRCENLKSIPEGLHNLCRLRYIRIWNCPSIVCFPEGGLPNTNLSFSIISCEKLKALPHRFHSLNYLQALEIRQCPSIKSFPDGGFPTNLTSLEVEDLNIYKPLVEWGLHKLTSLNVLEINGCPDAESFPQKELGMMLPPSLTRLYIKNFPKLKCLWFEGFGNRTSLEYLWIRGCPNLTSFPDSGLPSSLIYLYIRKCPSLKEQCKKNKGKEWLKISDIPCVYIDGRFIYSPDDEERAKNNLIPQ